MTGFVLSPAAQADVENIWDYTAENWGVDQAESYTRDIRNTCERLAAGERGRRVDIRDDYRKFPVGSHMLYFKIDGPQRIGVMRISHQSMDAERHL